MGYVKCPRCNLNYITEQETLCRVCLMETGKIESKKEDEFDDDLELCPECGENVIRPNETMCSRCAAEQQNKENVKDGLLDEFSDISEDSGNMEDEDMFDSIEEIAYRENEADENDDGLGE